MMRHLIATSLLVICVAALAPGAAAQVAGAQPLTTQDVVRLLKEEKLTAEQVKEKLRGAASAFDLSEAGLKQLQDAGADASLLAAMIQSPRYKGDWYVADLYEYFDTVQLSGTNYVPSLFNPLAPGIVYLVLLALLWLAISSLSGANGGQRRAKTLGAAIAVVLLASGVVMSSAGLLGYSYSAVPAAELGVGFLKKPIIPGHDPCAQAGRRPLSSATASASITSAPSAAAPPAAGGRVLNEPQTLDPLTKVRAGRESADAAARESDASLKPAAQQAQSGGGARLCRQPDTSESPNVSPSPIHVGRIMSPEGNTGDLYLGKGGAGYVLSASNVSSAGKYAGRVSADVIAPFALPVVLNVSDWWPYFFVAVALGILFTNTTIMPRLQPSLPHGAAVAENSEAASARREVAEAFGQGVNSTPIATLSSLAATLFGLYASYSNTWGLTTDYVKAFLAGAAITLGLRTLAGAANAAATRLERALKKEPTRFVNEVHLPPPPKS